MKTKLMAGVLVLCCCLPAAEIVVTLEVHDGYIPAIRAHLARNHLAEADRNGDGLVSNQEALAWYQRHFQTSFRTLVRRAIVDAEASNRNVLPPAHRDALAAQDTAKQSLESQREAVVAEGAR